MDFNVKRGIGYCGLACVLCSHEDCPGCAANINDREDDCAIRKCAAKKNIDGCYACLDYPCDKNIPLLKDERNKAFNRFMCEYGKQALIDRLCVNHENGITFYTPNGSAGDCDKLETENAIYQLLRYGRNDPYYVCPTYESELFLLRLVSPDDVYDLSKCYNDSDAQRLFNSDNCTSDFLYSTIDEMRDCIELWLDAYKKRGFIRYSIIDRHIKQVIGTIEIFGGEKSGLCTECGVLRIDLGHEYENEEAITDLLKNADLFFYDFNTEKFVTKAIPEAEERIKALHSAEYEPFEWEPGRDHYYMKRSPQNGDSK